MKRIVSVLLIMLLILVIFTLSLFAEEKYDFRKTNWGMGIEEVRIAERLDEVLPTLPTFITTRENDSGTVYTVQVGVFSKGEDAQNLAERISGKGYQIYVVKGKNLYKVQVGEFKSYKEAQSSSDKMEKEIARSLRNDLLQYQDYIYGFDCGIHYWFLEDKLYQGSYYFIKDVFCEDLCIEDYEGLKGLLIKKYGRPTMDKEEWKDDLSKKNELDRETAINKGHLVYSVGWENSTTKIFMILSSYWSSNFLEISYLSKELEGWVEQIKAENRQKQDEEILKDF